MFFCKTSRPQIFSLPKVLSPLLDGMYLGVQEPWSGTGQGHFSSFSPQDSAISPLLPPPCASWSQGKGRAQFLGDPTQGASLHPKGLEMEQ